MKDPLDAALDGEMTKLQAEEAAGSTRAERAADPSLATAVPDQAKGGANARATMDAISAMPPELITPLLVLALDMLVKRGVLLAGGSKETSEKFALTADERQQLTEVWLPVVRLYAPQLEVHPLLAAGGFTALVYTLKALPAGGLEAVLGGNGGEAAPQSVSPEPTTAALVDQPPPAHDAVLELARKAAEELKQQKEAEARKAPSA